MDFIPKIGITIGDVNGIGPEVILKALSGSKLNKLCVPIIYGSGKHLSKYKNLIELPNWQYVGIQHPDQAQQKHYNLINTLKGDFFELELGSTSLKAGKLAFDSLAKATSDLKEGLIDAIVTAPISKNNIQNDNFRFPGHTEYLADAFNSKEVMMFLVSEYLRVGVATTHVPLEKVKSNLTQLLITQKIEIMLQSLKIDFGISKPKIAVLGLNPHAGENGLMGNEEKQIIEPVVKKNRDNNNLVFGPFPADGFFASQAYRKYDAILGMYHDQGLIPFKMMAFDNGVNFTAGLPIVRTSPDHGTAFDIAGKNKASAGSMLEAIYTAVEIAKRRNEFKELDSNALRHQNINIDALKKERH